MNLNYQEKYLKYKNKYFKLRNQIGGSGIKIKSIHAENKVIDKSWSDGKNKNPITLYSNNPNNPNQTFLMKEYNGKLFIADENNLCISDNGKNNNGSKIIMDICDVNSPDQQFNIRTKLPDNKYIFENKNKDKCLDNNWNQNLTYWDCAINNDNPNQQFQIINSDMNIKDINLDEGLITPEIKQTKLLFIFPANKVDRDIGVVTYHINSKIQNLILSYPVNYELIDMGDGLDPTLIFHVSTASLIAQEATAFRPQDGTHSEAWCKLIWTALKRSQLPNTKFIPDEWIDINYNDLADKLLSISDKKGWAKYTMYILTDLNEELYNTFQNDFNQATFKKAFEIYDICCKI